MTDRFNDELPPQHREERQGKGCLFWGCLIVAVVLLLLVVGAVWSAYSLYSGLVQQYTATEPMAIEVVELPEEQMKALNERYEAFAQAVKAGENPGDLELTAEELNALIGQNADLAGRVFVRIADGQLGGDVSIPTDFLPMVGAGRYFNASGQFEASMENGVLVVTLADATVNGKPVPEEFLAGLKDQNLAKDLYDNADNAKALRQFESLTIEGDKVILKARPAEDLPDAGDAAGDTAEEDAAEPADDPASGDQPPAEPDDATPPSEVESTGEAPQPAPTG
ncbi:hypothetical protein [Botrimarina sp.]|uniref:hypothetical protein n=1 Tax=Botrimarina sp. TaxID=2795802 RepID=UPI0032F08082